MLPGIEMQLFIDLSTCREPIAEGFYKILQEEQQENQGASPSSRPP